MSARIVGAEPDRPMGPPGKTVGHEAAGSDLAGEAGCQGDVLFHGVLFTTAAVVLVLACVMRIVGEEQVALPLIDQPLPGVCTYKWLFGVDCPGCGLTRCFISLADGDVTRAWHFNPAGVLLFTVAAVQLPYRAAQIWRLRRGSPEFRIRWLTQATFWLCLGALLGQWLWRTFAIQVAGPL